MRRGGTGCFIDCYVKQDGDSLKGIKHQEEEEKEAADTAGFDSQEIFCPQWCSCVPTPGGAFAAGLPARCIAQMHLLISGSMGSAVTGTRGF